MLTERLETNVCSGNLPNILQTCEGELSEALGFGSGAGVDIADEHAEALEKVSGWRQLEVYWGRKVGKY
jgi:hypothetical protein